MVTRDADALESPTTATTIVVLLGASEYPQKPSWTNPVLGASAAALRAYLLSPTGFALASEQVLDLFDDDADQVHQLLQIEEFLATAGRHARDLILYYVGHGGFDNGDYYLGVRRTQRDREFITTIESRKLAKIIREGFRRKRLYVILDACFSASAASDWQGEEAEAAVRKLTQHLPRQGTALLAASSKYDVTRAPRAERYTIFTGAVLEALTRGVDNARPGLSLYELYDEVREVLRRRETDDDGRPELHIPSQRDGDISQLPVFPNAAFPRVIEATRSLAEVTVRAKVAESATEQVPPAEAASMATKEIAPADEPVRDRDRAGPPIVPQGIKEPRAAAGIWNRNIWSMDVRDLLRGNRVRREPDQPSSRAGAAKRLQAALHRPIRALLAWACVGLLVPFVGPVVLLYSHAKLTRSRPSDAQEAGRLIAARLMGLIGTLYTVVLIGAFLRQ